jgi:ABC-type bacteriocin/lantibiotic exporter with double-glycine peptidase domain
MRIWYVEVNGVKLMNFNLIMTIVMLITAVAFLILFFVYPDEVRIGAFVSSLIIACIFYVFHKKSKASH